MARRILPPRNAGRGQRPVTDGIDNQGFPTREALLGWIEQNPDLASKRDLAKAFGLKGEDRVRLKQMLAELADEGLLTSERRSFRKPGALPPVVAAEIFARDSDGGLMARPVELPEGADPVVIGLRSKRGGKGPAPGIGDRVLIMETRPLSKNKRWRLVEILEKAK